MSTNVGDKTIQLTSGHHLSISKLVIISVWLVTSSYFIISYTQLLPLQNKLMTERNNLEKKVEENKDENTAMNILEEKYQEILNEQNQPIAFSPANEEDIIGSQVSFAWDYRDHGPSQRYILEIINIDINKTFRFNVVNPDLRSMSVPVKRIGHGEFLWRIIPGYHSEESEVSLGVSSDFSYFRIFPTLWDKMLKNNQLIIATTPSLISPFSFLTADNEIVGFDIDLMQWLVDEINDDLQLSPGIELLIHRLPRSKLLPSLKDKKIDLIISNMTSTKQREENYDVVFSQGYYHTHEIILTSNKRDNDFPDRLKGTSIGVVNGTSNEDSARYLSHIYKFKVKSYFMSWEQVYQALENDEIDFAIVNKPHALSEVEQGRFDIYGPNLNSLLMEFYEERFGRKGHVYAIALHRERNNKLLKEINKLLRSKKGQTMLELLEEKWIDDNPTYENYDIKTIRPKRKKANTRRITL